MREVDELARRVAAWLTPGDARALLKRKVGSELGFLDDLAGSSGLSHPLTCRAIAASYGVDMLFDRAARRAIVSALPTTTIDEAWEALRLESDGVVPPVDERRSRIEELQLQRGSYRARRLCEVLNFPYECAGEVGEGGAPAVEFFSPQIDLPELHPYQKELARSIQEDLLNVGGDRRGMLALPTGGGKTRVVLETVLNWEPIQSGSGALLWVAQHSELCEQAIECVAQVWASQKRPANRSIKLQRVWGGKSEELDWTCDVIVGIPESLSPRVLQDRPGARRRLAAIVIDEAHLALDSTYDKIFQLAGVARVPILGVSATPANPQDRDGVLQQCFENRLLRATSLEPAPYDALRQQRILSEVSFRKIDTGVTVEMTRDEREDVRESRGDYGTAILAKLGRSSARNRIIVEALSRLPEDLPTLCFTSSVPSAHALAAAMTIVGRKAAVIDASTPAAVRRKILTGFRCGATQFLFNFGVLATGFDAPSVSCILMARPTRSEVLLEQMIGRGLRGPKNGGTEKCTVLWIEDQFKGADELQPQSYQRFANLWKARNG